MSSSILVCKKKKNYPQIVINKFYTTEQFEYIYDSGIDFSKQYTQKEELSLQRMWMFEQISVQIHESKLHTSATKKNPKIIDKVTNSIIKAKNSTFSKYRTIILNQVRKSKIEQQFQPSEDNTPKESTEVKESMNKLREYFAKQEQQKKKITRSLRYIGNKTPGQSPRGYKSPQQKDFIPYLSYRRIELIHLKPLKFSDTLKSFQIHKKTMSSQL